MACYILPDDARTWRNNRDVVHDHYPSRCSSNSVRNDGRIPMQTGSTLIREPHEQGPRPSHVRPRRCPPKSLHICSYLPNSYRRLPSRLPANRKCIGLSLTSPTGWPRASPTSRTLRTILASLAPKKAPFNAPQEIELPPDMLEAHPAQAPPTFASPASGKRPAGVAEAGRRERSNSGKHCINDFPEGNLFKM